MMARTSSARAWRLTLGLVLAALLAAALAPAFAQEGPPAEPLVPNYEPEASAQLQAAPQSEAEAVAAALAAYAADDEAAATLADLPPEALLLTGSRVYLPLVQRGVEPPLDPGQEPTPTPRPDRAADVAVTVRARPSILVRPGELITFTFTLRNLGSAEASETRVSVPISGQQVAPAYTSLSSRAGDWLSENSRDRYTVTFGPLAKGAERSGQVVVRVNAGLPVRATNPVVIETRARYTWRDGSNGGERRSNWAPVVVGSGAVHGDFVWVRVSPDRGPIGTTHVFFSNRFLPGERVSAWVNVNRGAGGVRALSLSGTANSLGEVELRLRSTDADPDLPRGTHQIVLAGQRSGLQGVVDFIVQ